MNDNKMILLNEHRKKMDFAVRELRDAMRGFEESYGRKTGRGGGKIRKGNTNDTPTAMMTWSAMTEWKCMLAEKDYKPAVIEDIMRIAQISMLEKEGDDKDTTTRNRKDSAHSNMGGDDTDSEESVGMFEMDQDYWDREQRRKEAEADNEILPQWANHIELAGVASEKEEDINF